MAPNDPGWQSSPRSSPLRRPETRWIVAILGGIAAAMLNQTPTGLAVAGTLLFIATVLVSTTLRFWFAVSAGLGVGVLMIIIARVFEGQSGPYAPWVLVFAAFPVVAAATAALESAFAASTQAKDELAEAFTQASLNQAIDRATSEVGHVLASTGRAGGPMYAALRDFMNATGADSLTVRRNVLGGEGDPSSVLEMFVSSDGPRPRYSPHRMSWETLPGIAALLSENRTYATHRWGDLPEADRQTLEKSAVAISAVAVVPIWHRGDWLGTVSLAYLSERGPFSTHELIALRTLGDMMATAWLRDDRTTQLETALEVQERALRAQRALVEGTRILLDPATPEPVTQLLELVMTAVDGDVAYLERFIDKPDGVVSRRVQEICRDPADARKSHEWRLETDPEVAAELLAGEIVLLSVPDTVGEDSDVTSRVGAPGRAEIKVPIVKGGSTVGVVGVATLSARVWTASDREVMASLARMLDAHLEREDPTGDSRGWCLRKNDSSPRSARN